MEVCVSVSDLDIIDIDNKIRFLFEEEYKKLSKYKERLTELEQTQSSRSEEISVRSKNNLDKSINKLKDDIEKIESKRDLNFYIVETTELLQKYNAILKTPVKLSFTGKNKQDNKEKTDIIISYIKTAQKYYDFNVKTPERKFNMCCDNCPNKTNFLIEDNSFICEDCWSQQDLLQHTTSYKDTDRVNITAKYTYDRKVHFRDCINQYQGKQNCTVDQKVYDDLEDIFERHHLLRPEEKFSGITKLHILMFLKELGYSKHYENVNFIHYNLTGIKPDDISHLEDRLLEDFDLLVETYDKHFKNRVDRVNFISTQYVLYQLLLKYKHVCKKEDFVILKTVERQSFHDDVCSELFQVLGWTFHTLYG